MLSTSTLLTNVLLAISVVGSPVTIRDNAQSINLPFAMNLKLSGRKLPELDRARAMHLMSQGERLSNVDNDESTTLHAGLSRRSSSFNATNNGIVYLANVSVGNPGTTYSLIIDTGSANTWVGANKSYTQTSSSKSTGQNFTVNYGSGNVTGHAYTDRVALSDSLVIDQQSIGVATSANGFDAEDGILGLGPVAQTKNTVAGMKQVPTVTDNLYKQKTISTEVIGISFSPSSSNSSTNGQLTFGGVDSSKYTGSITYASITRSSPANRYWGLDQSVTYGSNGSTILSSTAGILDTGTTLILLATDAFQRYQTLVGATFDDVTGLLKITNDQYQKLQSLYFNVDNTKFELTPNAQIWPRSLNSAMGGSPDSIYLVVSDLGTSSGQGLDFVNGYTFLQRFYSVYDTTNKRVGLANTGSTNATTN